MIEVYISKADMEKICSLDEFDKEEGILQTSGAEYIKFITRPERSKREDSTSVRCMESGDDSYFVVAQVNRTNEWIEKRCSEH